MDFHVAFNVYERKYKYKYLALYHALREAIVEGRIQHGTKLPSSREMAEMYVLSRGSVNQTYEMLFAEGYVDSEVGKGTFVTFRQDKLEADENAQTPIYLSEWGKRISAFRLREPRKSPNNGENPQVSFTVGLPDITHFPFQEWNRHLYTQVREMGVMWEWEAFATHGHLSLREAISQHLTRSRGIHADAEQIAIVNGSMQAIGLLSLLLINPGDSVVVENPGYIGTRRAVEASGGIPFPAEVDRSGVMPATWTSRLLFVTPGRQYPTGAVLTLERRLEILQWAAGKGAFIVEDDYDCEFRRQGRPVEPLKVLDREERVIFIGTFSKTLLPDLRVGYVVLPRLLVEPFRKAKQLFEPHPANLLEQKAVAAFMKSGQYERHLKRMNRIYRRKHDLMYGLLQKELGHLFDFIESDAGLHIFGTWRHSRGQYVGYMSACNAAGIRWTDASEYDMHGGTSAACFGFSHLSEQEMMNGVAAAATM